MAHEDSTRDASKPQSLELVSEPPTAGPWPRWPLTTVTAVLLLAMLSGLLYLGITTLSPFWIDLVANSPLEAANGALKASGIAAIGHGITVIILLAGVVAAVHQSTKAQTVIYLALALLAVGMFITRYSNEQRRAKRAAIAAIEEAHQRSETLRAEQKKLLDAGRALVQKGEQILAPKMRAQGLDQQKLALSMSTTVEPKPHVPFSWDSVLGPTLVELVTALLFELLAGAWGLLALALWRYQAAASGAHRVFEEAPDRLEVETPSKTSPSEAVPDGPHNSLDGVDLAKLDPPALDGLDVEQGTWRDLPLGEPKERRFRDRPSVRWPTIDPNAVALRSGVLASDQKAETWAGRTVYIGSQRACRLTPDWVPSSPPAPRRNRVVDLQGYFSKRLSKF